jgi:hypothetical protein
MSVFNIAGTSGSGKSHLARSFLSWAKEHGKVVEQFVKDREAPIGYDLMIKSLRTPVHLLGSYRTPTGGCDTLRDVKTVFDIVRQQYFERSVQVVYEGLFVMNHTRGPELVTELEGDMTILQLTTPLSTCYSSINQRRSEKGDGKLLSKENTRSNFVRAENYCAKMRSAGATVIRVRRDQALDCLIDELRGAD